MKTFEIIEMSLRQKQICADFVGGDRVEIRVFF